VISNIADMPTNQCFKGWAEASLRTKADRVRQGMTTWRTHNLFTWKQNLFTSADEEGRHLMKMIRE